MRYDKVLYIHWQRYHERPWATYCYGVYLRTGRYPFNAVG